MLAEPVACVLVVRTRPCDQSPEPGGMVHALQVHELVNHHIVSDLRRHLHEAPVQADVTVRRARPPAPPLIAYGHSSDAQLVFGCQFEQPCRQLELGPRAQCVLYLRIDRLAGPRTVESQFAPLLLNPRPLLLGKRTCLPFRSASWDRDSNSAIGGDPNDVAAGSGVANESDVITPRAGCRVLRAWCGVLGGNSRVRGTLRER